LIRGSHVAKSAFDRTVHVNWNLIGRPALIRLGWKFLAAFAIFSLRAACYFPAISHVSNADWFVPFMKPSHYATWQKKDTCYHLIGPRCTSCQVSNLAKKCHFPHSWGKVPSLLRTGFRTGLRIRRQKNNPRISPILKSFFFFKLLQKRMRVDSPLECPPGGGGSPLPGPPLPKCRLILR
jgi:hypothetical protein